MVVILLSQPPGSRLHFDLLRDVKILISMCLCHSPSDYFQNQDTSEINLDSSNMNYLCIFHISVFLQLTPQNSSNPLKSHMPAEHPGTVSFLLDWGRSHYIKKNLGRHHLFCFSGSRFRQEPRRELESPTKRDSQKMAKSAAKSNTMGCFALWSLQILLILPAEVR